MHNFLNNNNPIFNYYLFLAYILYNVYFCSWLWHYFSGFIHHKIRTNFKYVYNNKTINTKKRCVMSVHPVCLCTFLFLDILTTICLCYVIVVFSFNRSKKLGIFFFLSQIDKNGDIHNSNEHKKKFVLFLSSFFYLCIQR